MYLKELKNTTPYQLKISIFSKVYLELGGYPFLSNTLQPQQLDRFLMKCLVYRVVYETAYRDVSEREPSYHCCPGWTQQPKASHGCTTRKYSSIQFLRLKLIMGSRIHPQTMTTMLIQGLKINQSVCSKTQVARISA